jgi:hypothetical protein
MLYVIASHNCCLYTNKIDIPFLSVSNVKRNLESTNMSTAKPFPAITGSCVCNTVRYRLLTSPLYCYACHCIDCQKSTGSAFAINLNIETDNIHIISPTAPVYIKREKKLGVIDRHAECPQCRVELWSNNALGDAIADVRVGTLDFASLMEPDCHIFVDSKLDWIRLPDDAKTMPQDYDLKKFWPKSSLKRLELCIQRATMLRQRTIDALEKRKDGADDEAANGEEEISEDVSAEGDKTPTAVEFGGEDDEAFEKRFKETEKALQERLEKLSIKLEEEEVTKKMEQTSI